MAGLLDAVSDAVQEVKDTVQEGVMEVAFKYAAEKVKEHTGIEMEVVAGDIPSDWLDWMRKTGANSLCADRTWDFLEKGPGCDRRLKKWEGLNIKKIVMSVEDESKLDDYEKRWWVANVSADAGVMTIKFCPRAKNWASDCMWAEPGAKKWWYLRDAIVFDLGLYELEGKCFYKSGWVEEFEDVDPNSCLPNGKAKFKRWLQFRHWTLMWFEKAQSGWNYQYTKKPPPSLDGLDFSLDSILDLPDMPSMPSISFPQLPDLEMPDMPSVDLPSIEAPSMPSFDPSMPSFDPSMSLPSMEERKERPSNRWACHGIIELNGLKVKADGSSIILSDATVHHFWEKDHRIDTEKKEHERYALQATSAEQAQSWFESFIEVKCEEGDLGGCCTIA